MANFFSKIIDGFRSDADDDGYLDDDFFEDEEEYEKPSKKQKEKEKSGGLFQRKVIPVNSDMGVITIKPNGMDDTREICNYLLDGRAVVLNMEGISTDIAQRVIDFTLGTIYAIGGDLQMVSKYIFIASPPNVELAGDFQGDIAGNSGTPLSRQGSNGGFTFNV